MKKLIIAIGSLFILVFVLVLFTHATEASKDKKKDKTEANKVEVAAPCPAKCDPAACHQTVPCDPAKCKEMGCTHKNGKCDPASCMAQKGEGFVKSSMSIDMTPCPVNCSKKK